MNYFLILIGTFAAIIVLLLVLTVITPETEKNIHYDDSEEIEE